jgi:hypothetical protein
MKSINLILFKNKISFFKKINLTKTKKKIKAGHVIFKTIEKYCRKREKKNKIL